MESNIKCPEPGCGGILKCQPYLYQHNKNVHQKGSHFIYPMCSEQLWHGTNKKNHLKKHCYVVPIWFKSFNFKSFFNLEFGTTHRAALCVVHPRFTKSNQTYNKSQN